MKKILLFITLFALFSGVLNAGKAGKAEDIELFEKAGELSYEGQLKHAKELLEAPVEETPQEKKDDSWEGTSLLLGMIWGSIGTGFFIYGKKQSKALYIICGIALFVVPYFIGNVLVNAITGTVLTIIPFKVDL